jgi:hypothetical protein
VGYEIVVIKLDKLEQLLKHQPGRHDQQRHDPHKGGSVTVSGFSSASKSDVAYVNKVVQEETAKLPADHLEGFSVKVLGKGKGATAGKVGHRTSPTIRIPRRDENGKPYSKSDIADFFRHEVGHQVWHRKLTDMQRQDWIKAGKQISLTTRDLDTRRAFPYLDTALRNTMSMPKHQRDLSFGGEVFAELYNGYNSYKRGQVEKLYNVRYRRLQDLHNE